MTTILLTLAAALIPVIVGFLLVKLYRLVFPIKDTDTLGIDDIVGGPSDSFGKILITGWIVCSPFYYWIWDSGMVHRLYN